MRYVLVAMLVAALLAATSPAGTALPALHRRAPVAALPPGSAASPAAAAASAAAGAILAGEAPRAIGALTPLVDTDPRNLELRGLLALALYLNGQKLQAMRHAFVLRRQDPQGRETAFLVSRRLLPAFQQDTKVAAQLVDLLSQGGDGGFLWLAQVHQERGAYEDAVTILTRGVALYPRSAKLLDGLGFNAWKAGMQEEAIAAYRKAIHLQPSWWGLYFNLGWVYFTGRRYSNAASTWRTALRLNPGQPALPDLIREAERRAGS